MSALNNTINSIVKSFGWSLGRSAETGWGLSRFCQCWRGQLFNWRIGDYLAMQPVPNVDIFLEARYFAAGYTVDLR